MKIFVPLLILALVAIAPNDAFARDPFTMGAQARVDVNGSYSGVLVADQNPSSDAITAEDIQRTEALGLFTLGVPTTGLATGTVLIFSRGRVFRGGMSGFADPDGGNVFAVIDTDFDFAISFPNPGGGFDVVDVTASAKGIMTARVVQPTFDRGSFSSTTRITGSASLDFSDGQVDQDGADIIRGTINFTVSGVRQASFFAGGEGGGIGGG